MRRTCRSLAAATVVSLLGAGAASGQAPTPADSIVVSHSQITTNGRTLRYTIRAGLLPILVNDTGELMARMFFVSYTVDRTAAEPVRPLTFLWNGGPGSSASQEHLVGFGPKRIKTGDTYPAWGPNTETRIVDHPETWLATSDLVFVDPVGTGFSRATSIANRDTLYTSRGDAEAVAEFIRLYRTRYHAWNVPIFLAGESYGTTRAMLVSEMLERRRDHLSGVILISGFYNLGQNVPAPLAQALQISLLTATGHYYKKLAPELQAMSRDDAVKAAINWARDVYAPALARRDSLTTGERTSIRNDLKRFTGIDPKYVDPQRLSITKEQYLDHLLDEQKLELGRYDSRMSTRSRADGVPWSPMIDPSLAPMIDLMQGTSVLFNSYIRDTLKYRSDLLYRGPFGEAFHPGPLTLNPAGIASDWMTMMFKMDNSVNGGSTRGGGRAGGASGDSAARGGRAGAAQPAPPPLRHAMELNPKLQVMVVEGIYDGSCAAMEENIARTDAPLRSRVSEHCYTGGHMLYTDVETRKQLQRDFAAFVRASRGTP